MPELAYGKSIQTEIVSYVYILVHLLLWRSTSDPSLILQRSSTTTFVNKNIQTFIKNCMHILQTAVKYKKKIWNWRNCTNRMNFILWIAITISSIQMPYYYWGLYHTTAFFLFRCFLQKKWLSSFWINCVQTVLKAANTYIYSFLFNFYIPITWGRNRKTRLFNGYG